jgi:hypothetical protein
MPKSTMMKIMSEGWRGFSSPLTPAVMLDLQFLPYHQKVVWLFYLVLKVWETSSKTRFPQLRWNGVLFYGYIGTDSL